VAEVAACKCADVCYLNLLRWLHILCRIASRQQAGSSPQEEFEDVHLARVCLSSMLAGEHVCMPVSLPEHLPVSLPELAKRCFPREVRLQTNLNSWT
jgi:hypothetical protein